MFRKMHEVLFRKEIMCAARFSTSGVAHLRMTERNTTKRGYAIWKRNRDQCRCDNGRRRCVQCVWQKGWNPIYGGLSWWITPAISRWTAWHTHKSTTDSRDKVSFSFTQGIPFYSEVPIRHITQCTLYGTDCPSKTKATYFSVGPRKMVTVKCYVHVS